MWKVSMAIPDKNMSLVFSLHRFIVCVWICMFLWETVPIYFVYKLCMKICVYVYVWILDLFLCVWLSVCDSFFAIKWKAIKLYRSFASMSIHIHRHPCTHSITHSYIYKQTYLSDFCVHSIWNFNYNEMILFSMNFHVTKIENYASDSNYKEKR